MLFNEPASRLRLASVHSSSSSSSLLRVSSFDDHTSISRRCERQGYRCEAGFMTRLTDEDSAAFADGVADGAWSWRAASTRQTGNWRSPSERKSPLLIRDIDERIVRPCSRWQDSVLVFVFSSTWRLSTSTSAYDEPATLRSCRERYALIRRENAWSAWFE